jgi:hypothetical protein
MHTKNEVFVGVEDSDMTIEEFDSAMKGLVAKGLMEEVIVNGEPKYRLTPMGRSVGQHMNSTTKDQN